MTLDDLAEAKATLATLLKSLSAVAAGSVDIAATNLHYAIGDLVSNADYLLRSNTVAFASALLKVCELATVAGGTIAEFEAVRKTLLGLSPVSAPAITIVMLGNQMILSQEVAIYANTTFTSRQQVDAALAQIIEAFEAAIDYAADNQDPASRQALGTAMSAICNHLNSTARPLPKMVTYSVGRVLTSLALANRIYGDASRADELVDENGFVQPAFCGASGVALSA